MLNEFDSTYAMYSLDMDSKCAPLDTDEELNGWRARGKTCKRLIRANEEDCEVHGSHYGNCNDPGPFEGPNCCTTIGVFQTVHKL